jgi:hypothetical protein
MPNANAARSRSTQNNPPADPQANKPVEKFNEGPVHVSIWEKSGTKGLFRTASFQLRYRDGEEWKTSQSYGLLDLERLEKAAGEARDRIEKWQQTQRSPTSAP